MLSTLGYVYITYFGIELDQFKYAESINPTYTIIIVRLNLLTRTKGM